MLEPIARPGLNLGADPRHTAEIVRICGVTQRNPEALIEQSGNRPFRVHEAVGVRVPRDVVYRRVDTDPAMSAELGAVAARAPSASGQPMPASRSSSTLPIAAWPT